MPQKDLQEAPMNHTTSDALEILAHMIKGDTELEQMIEEESLHAHVAQLIVEQRTAAGLTQRQLAELIGTQQPVIARLEDADYEGHSLSMLNRIAKALHCKLDIRFTQAA